MSQTLVPVAEQPSAPTVGRGSRNRRRWFELALVMFLAFSGSLIRAIALLKLGPSFPNQIGVARWIEAGAHQIGILFLVGYLLSLNGRTFRDIGFRWSFAETVYGLLLYVAAFIIYSSGALFIHLGYYLLYGTYRHYVDSRQIFGHMPLMALPFWLLNPFYEEIVVRAYLMTEMRELTGSVILSAVASVVLQTSYHLYYGWAAAFALGIQFVVFAGYFALWRRALPLAIAHGLCDFVGFMRLRWASRSSALLSLS